MNVEALQVVEILEASGNPINPIGDEKSTTDINSFLNILKKKWDELTISLKETGTFSFKSAVKFLFFSLDALIMFAENVLPGETGADKKATVLMGVGILYEYVLKQFLPLWLRPFATSIKTFVVSTLCSIAIDWIVSKYNKGSWLKVS